MRAAVDALLVADSSPTNTEAVRQKVNQISNLEIRDALLARVDIITKRKYP
jgi:hypothetical protein